MLDMSACRGTGSRSARPGSRGRRPAGRCPRRGAQIVGPSGRGADCGLALFLSASSCRGAKVAMRIFEPTGNRLRSGRFSGMTTSSAVRARRPRTRLLRSTERPKRPSTATTIGVSAALPSMPAAQTSICAQPATPSSAPMRRASPSWRPWKRSTPTFPACDRLLRRSSALVVRRAPAVAVRTTPPENAMNTPITTRPRHRRRSRWRATISTACTPRSSSTGRPGTLA